uniref:Tether containing UBX domain for GLUT4 n=1 Tax=Cacopsylla melanoneura TaxID=428564 RepID=A0A8D8SHX9_9HEMI
MSSRETPGSRKDPQPGPSNRPEPSSLNSIAIAFPKEPKSGPCSKLDLLTNEQIDNYLSIETLAQYEFSGDRHLLFFDLHEIEVVTPPSENNVEDVDDTFFELSKGEAQRLLRDIIRTRDQLENGQLMTKAMRDLNAAKRTLATLYQYNYSVVRLHLPGGLVMQALFKPLENIGKVKAFVRTLLREPDLDFYIYFTPPKQILQDSSTLLDLHCVPTSNFYFGVQDDTPSIAHPSARGGLQQEITPCDVDMQCVASNDRSQIKSESGGSKSEGATIKSEGVVIKSEGASEGSLEWAQTSGKTLGGQSVEVESYFKADVLEKHMVKRSLADAKAAEFRKSRNPALNFMNDEESSDLPSLPSSSKSSQVTPAVPKGPRTSQDKIPKWFKPGGK